ncbi:MAG: S-layer homology domain-containing protein, partial [Anaerovorax sp.]
SVSDFGGGKVSITVDYKPKSGEDTDHIVIYHLKDDGSIDVIKDCKYDAKTGKLSFAASSFSYFMLGYESQMKKTFQDVPTHVWYYDSVSYLIEKNLIKGKTATSFAPESNITRAEFVQILYNMAGKSAQESKDPGTIYRDVAANAWYYNAVAWGTKVGVVTGEGNLFRPTDKVSRQEMAVMLDRYVKNVAKVSLKETKGQLTFMDAQAIGQWARPSVTIMQKAGVINGIEKGAGTFNFAPTDRATRAQAAQMISALVKQLS